jgi:colanic acid biosynthesis glycosyl transferase WcaI
VRILLLSQHYAPETGAPQQRWSGLVREFRARGHDVHVVTPPPHYPGGSLLPGHEHLGAATVGTGEHGETVHRVRYRPHDGRVRSRVLDEVVVAAAATRAAGSALGPWRPDVVVATVPSLPMLWAGRRAARRLGVPFVAEVRDAWPDLLVVAEDWDDRSIHGARGRLHRSARATLHRLGALATRAQREADAVVVTTDSFADVLRSRGVREVHVVRNAAHEVPGVVERRGDDGELHVLYAGTIGRSQGLSTAVHAAAAARERGVALTLRLVGDGADRVALQRLVEHLRAPVELLPSVPRTELGRHYSWADTGLVSLRPWGPFSYTVPSKLYEMMRLGLHVTACVDGEAADIVRGQRAGSVSCPGDVDALAATWSRLAADRGLLDVPATGREWVADNADAAVLAARYEAVLTGVTGARAR